MTEVEKLLMEAAEAIKMYCSERHCFECGFLKSGRCIMRGIPEEWKVGSGYEER